MDRRGFLTGILAIGAAPAIVHASSLMRIARPSISEVMEYSGIYAPSISDEVLTYEDFAERFIYPALSAMVDSIDSNSLILTRKSTSLNWNRYVS